MTMAGYVGVIGCLALVCGSWTYEIRVENNGNDGPFNHAIALRQDIRVVTDNSRLQKNSPQNNTRNVMGMIPDENFDVGRNQQPFPDLEEENERRFGELLCRSDCRMTDMMVFGGQPGNMPFRDVKIAGRPYTFGSLADWCRGHCGAGASQQIAEMQQRAVGSPPQMGIHPKVDRLRQVHSATTEQSQPPSQLPHPQPLPKSPPQPAPHGRTPSPYLPLLPAVYYYPHPGYIPFRGLAKDGSSTWQRVKNPHEGVSPVTKPSGQKSMNADDDVLQVPMNAARGSKEADRSELYVYRSSPRMAEDNEKREPTDELQESRRNLQIDDDDTGDVTKQPRTLPAGTSESSEDGLDALVQFLRQVSRILSDRGFRALLKKAAKCDERLEFAEARNITRTG